MLPNGDWSKTDTIEHWCGPGCCADPEDTLRKFDAHFITACFMGMYKILQRAKMLQGHIPFDQQVG